ncbi:MAG: hypothetical protein Q9166_002328 [cf. Caloplaca sp. 2 TL-2023]
MIGILNPSTRVPLARQVVRYVCFLLFVLALFSVLYRRFWLDADDPYKCCALLTRGHWLDPSTEPYTLRHFENWQPPGCIMHEYTGKDIRNCLYGQRIVYIGDSTTRQLFWATAKKLNATAADEEMREAGKHEDLTFEDSSVTVDFVWDPFLNSTSLRRELFSYLDEDMREDPDTVNPAGLVTVSGGLWYARHFELDWLDHFKDALDYVAPLMSEKRTTASTRCSPPSTQKRRGGHHVYLAPVQVPSYDILSPSRASTITPAKINPMNEYLYNLSITTGTKVLWSHSLMTWKNELAYEESGLHVIENVAIRKVDVILNMRCNAQMTLSQSYPFDKTCCSTYERPKPLQTRFFLALLFIPPLIIGTKSYSTLLIASSFKLYRPGRSRTPNHTLSSYNLFGAFATLSIVLTYCAFADRTQLYNKAQKHFDYQDFFGFCAIVLTFGVFSLRRSIARGPPTRHALDSHHVADQLFLSRDQTDEWKGWMQFAILIYHYTGASGVLGIYQIIRILVASYLFMTGFGHTVFFYTKGNYSPARCASVLVRLNFLSCILPYIMDSDYLFYYFAPLVSFWYMVVYLTMRTGSSNNTSMPFLLAKIGVSAMIVTTLVRIPMFFDRMFLLLKYTCNIHWNVKEWRFRLQLDCYIVYVGMLAAIAYCKISDALHDKRAGLIQRQWNKIRSSSVATALIVLPSFWNFTQTFSNKFEYNRWVPFISLFPILSFIILRNCNRHLRNFYSAGFAWLGRCSLETFTLQFHIWLAADTKGLLSLGVFGRKDTHIEVGYHDLAVLTLIFFWLSGLTADATVKVTNWIIDPKLKYVHDTEMTPMPMTNEMELRPLLGESGGSRTQPGTLSRALSKWYDLWMEKLEIRLASIILLMWVLNILKL